jgi:hypothetical protein
MAEIGFIPCARVALSIGQAVLPAYRSKFSKRQFGSPGVIVGKFTVSVFGRRSSPLQV